MRRFTLLAILCGTAFTACQTTQPDAPTTIIAPETVQTCMSVASLTKKVIPAETKVQYAITEIDNPPYEPIQTKVKQIKVVKPAEVVYINEQGSQIVDICETNIEIGEVGPGVGEVIPEPEG